jgi:intergrase/recombinase
MQDTISAWAGSLARLGHPLDVIIDWNAFRRWLKTKYSKQYVATTFSYAKRFYRLLYGDLKEIEIQPIKDSTKSTIVKALIVLSKFLGIHKEFKERLTNYGIKIHREDSFSSFLRIFNNNNNDILEWLKEVFPILRDNERTFLKFCLYTGLRKTEAITSFNKIIQLSRENKLVNYYDSNLNCLMHFKYPREFIRIKKNAFLSFIPEYLILEIAKSEPVSYNGIRKKLQRKGIRVRINELRDFYGTFMLQHGLLEQEVNLLQGRIPPSIFVKYYWTPKLSELRDRVFKALDQLSNNTLFS